MFDASIDRYKVYKVEDNAHSLTLDTVLLQHRRKDGCSQNIRAKDLSYSYFQTCINVYKVETIGDAYMVASGLPTVYERHAQEMSLLALELLDSVKHHVIPHLPEQNIELRIGLHSGLRGFRC